MVKQLYSDFDATITIRSANGKTFDQKEFPYGKLKNRDISSYSKAIEEIVVIKHEQKWLNANLYGVENSFLLMSDMKNHLVEGEAYLTKGKIPFAIAGAGLLEKLQAYVHDEKDDYEYLELYFPLREAKMSIGSSPFNSEFVRLSASFNFNKDVNHESVVLPLEFAQEQLEYGDDISCIYVHVPEERKISKVREALQQTLGSKWVVKTQFEKNELIYKTSRTEKIIVIGILIFVFIISAFNLMTAIIMSMLEKKKDIFTLLSFGATKKNIFYIFFFNGLMIAFKGIAAGLVIGYSICLLQLWGGIIRIPNANNDIFPIQINFSDGILILVIVSSLSMMATYIPVKYLLKKLKRHE